METTTEMELPDGWRKGKIGDIASIRYGKAKPSDNGEIPVIGSSGTYSTTANALIDFPTIVVGRKGSAGKAWLQESPCWPSDTTFYLEWKKEPTDLYFVYYSVIANPLSGKNAQTTMPSIQKSELEDFFISLPPLPEQRAIANVLGAVQAALAARRREQQLEREHKAALLEQLFTRGTRGEATRETAVGEVPVGWEVVKLGDYCLSSAYGPRFSGDCYDKAGNVATLRTTDIGVDGSINYATMPLAKLDLSRFKNHLLETDDFLITRSGTCGIASVFEDHNKPVLPGAFLIRLRLKSGLTPRFLQGYINSPVGKPRIAALAVGAVQKNINGTNLLNTSIPLPPLPEQERIASVLGTLDARLGALAAEVARLEELFRALLEELLSGRRRVGAANVIG